MGRARVKHAWFPLYPGDYFNDTGHLTCLQHGAYTQLIYRAWLLGHVPDDDVLLSKLVGLRLNQWRAIAPVVRPFFRPGPVPGTLVSPRLERERARAAEVSRRRADAANTRHRAGSARAANPYFSEHETTTLRDGHSPDKPLNGKRTPHAHAPGLPMQNGTQLQSQVQVQEGGDACASPAPRRRAAKPEAYSEEFEVFWSMYPPDEWGRRRSGKKPSFRIWQRALKGGATGLRIIAALEADIETVFARASSPAFIPDPEKWLNRERWANGSAYDDDDAGPGTPPVPPAPQSRRLFD